jgi:hypothetical protein
MLLRRIYREVLFIFIDLVHEQDGVAVEKTQEGRKDKKADLSNGQSGCSNMGRRSGLDRVSLWYTVDTGANVPSPPFAAELNTNMATTSPVSV